MIRQWCSSESICGLYDVRLITLPTLVLILLSPLPTLVLILLLEPDITARGGQGNDREDPDPRRRRLYSDWIGLRCGNIVKST